MLVGNRCARWFTGRASYALVRIQDPYRAVGGGEARTQKSINAGVRGIIRPKGLATNNESWMVC